MLAKIVYLNDLALQVLPNGKKTFDFARGAEYTRQKINHNLKTWLNECFNNQTVGMPYRQRILVSSPDLTSIRSIFYQAIMKTAGVQQIVSLDLEFDKQQRLLLVSFEALLDNDETLRVDPRADQDFILSVAGVL